MSKTQGTSYVNVRNFQYKEFRSRYPPKEQGLNITQLLFNKVVFKKKKNLFIENNSHLHLMMILNSFVILQAVRLELMSRIEKKATYLHDLEEQVLIFIQLPFFKSCFMSIISKIIINEQALCCPCFRSFSGLCLEACLGVKHPNNALECQFEVQLACGWYTLHMKCAFQLCFICISLAGNTLYCIIRVQE